MNYEILKNVFEIFRYKIIRSVHMIPVAGILLDKRG